MLDNNISEIFTIHGNDVYAIQDRKIVSPVDAPLPKVCDGKVIMSFHGWLYTVSMDWLVDYAMLAVNLPVDYLQYINILSFKDFDLISHKVNYNKIPVFDKPVLYKYNSAYRVIAKYPYLATTKEGLVINVETHTEVKQMKGRYITIPVLEPITGKPSSQLLHRLVAMAWVDNDDYVNKPIVDHLDGNKHNPRYDNLEWVSFSENNRRASNTGLKNDNLDVKVMDYVTGDVRIFGSMTQACEYMGRSRINRLADFCAVPKLVNNRYQIKMLSDGSDWDFNTIELPISITLDGVTKRYGKIKDVVSEYFPSTNMRYNRDALVKKLKSLYPGIDIDMPNIAPQRKSNIQVMNTTTGEVKEYSSRVSVTVATGLSKSTVAKLITLEGKSITKGYRMRNTTDADWPDVCDVPKNLAKCITITRDADSYFKVEVDSIRGAAAYCGIDKKRVSNCLANNTSIKGYRFKQH